MLLIAPPLSQDPARKPERPDWIDHGDRILATWLLVEHENELALLRIAQQRAQDQDVRDSALEAIASHEQFVRRLQPFTGSASPAQPGIPGPTGTKQARDPKGEYPADGPAQGGGDRPDGGGSAVDAKGFDHLRLLRDLGRQYLASRKQLLEELPSTAFDRSFVDTQLTAHALAVDTLSVFRKHASETLRPILDEALNAVQLRLPRVKELARRTERAAAEAPRK